MKELTSPPSVTRMAVSLVHLTVTVQRGPACVPVILDSSVLPVKEWTWNVLVREVQVCNLNFLDSIFHHCKGPFKTVDLTRL